MILINRPQSVSDNNGIGLSTPTFRADGRERAIDVPNNNERGVPDGKFRGSAEGGINGPDVSVREPTGPGMSFTAGSKHGKNIPYIVGVSI